MKYQIVWTVRVLQKSESHMTMNSTLVDIQVSVVDVILRHIPTVLVMSWVTIHHHRDHKVINLIVNNKFDSK